VVERFERVAAQDVERDGIGGLSWGIVEGEQLVWANGFGWADWELRRPARPETVYPLGSLTSAITVTLLLQLAEHGVIGLDDPVVRYVPELSEMYGPPGYANTISLRQLATHTAGLMHSPPLPYSVPGAGSDWQARLVSLIPSTPLYYVPGEMYYYSGVGLGILALAVARAAQYPFADLAQDMIFQPLDMVMSGFVLSPLMEDALAVARVDSRRMPITPLPPSSVPRRNAGGITDAGAYTTVEDFGRFLSGLIGASRSPILTTAGSSGILDLGWRTDDVAAAGISMRSTPVGDRLVGNGTTATGHTAYADIDPTTGLGVVLFKSYDNGGWQLEQAASSALEELLQGSASGAIVALDRGTDVDTRAVPFAEVERRPVRQSCGPVTYPPAIAADPTIRVPNPATVALEFVIGTDGFIEPETVSIVSSPDTRFNSAAIAWARTCRFVPGQQQGTPVRVVVRQMVNFVRPR
jgi:TonB family protein